MLGKGIEGGILGKTYNDYPYWSLRDLAAKMAEISSRCYPG